MGLDSRTTPLMGLPDFSTRLVDFPCWIIDELGRCYSLLCTYIRMICRRMQRTILTDSASLYRIALDSGPWQPRPRELHRIHITMAAPPDMSCFCQSRFIFGGT